MSQPLGPERRVTKGLFSRPGAGMFSRGTADTRAPVQLRPHSWCEPGQPASFFHAPVPAAAVSMATSLSVISYFLFYGFSNSEALQTVYRRQRGKVLFLPAESPAEGPPPRSCPRPHTVPPKDPQHPPHRPHVQAPPTPAATPLPWLRPLPHDPHDPSHGLAGGGFKNNPDDQVFRALF